MKLEIELDLGKIDYDTINKQIADKMAALNIGDMYDIESKIHDKISTLIKEEVEHSYNNYLDRYWKDATSDGRQLIAVMSKAEIERRTAKVIEDVFANVYTEDAMREAMLKVLPNVFTNVLFTRLESTLFASEYHYQENMRSIIASDIEAAINRTIHL